MFRLIFIVVLAAMLCVSPAHANWFQRALERAVERTGTRAVDDAADSAYDAAKKGAKDSTQGSKRDERQERDSTSREEPVREPAPGKASPTPVTAPESAPASATGGQDLIAAEEIYNKYDFIPGDKVVFYDDFSDTDVGEFPRKWKLQGIYKPGIQGSNGVEVVEYQGKRFMRSVPTKKWPQATAAVDVRLAIPKDMPEKFTIEFDAVLGRTGPRNSHDGYFYRVAMYNEKTGRVHNPQPNTGGIDPGVISLSGEGADSATIRTPLNKSDQKIHRISISVNGTFVKAYIDHERVINDPDAIVRPVKYIGIGMGNFNEREGVQDIMITNFRIAEGGKDIKSALDTDGKIVTHGILFDSGSDRIKPESLPTLKMILKLLQDDPSLKFSVEGHTDNQGGPSVNQPLSEKRAQAVKAWLEGKGIAADRLTAKGWGQDKPMDTNGTAEGRANNRRVEFVKIR